MKNVLFYHVYLRDNTDAWLNVVLEQMKAMEDSQLSENLHEMYVTAITQDDSRKYHFRELMLSYGINMEIEFVENPFKSDYEMINLLNSDQAITENHTLRKIYNYSVLTQDVNICYIHTKGATRTVKPSTFNARDVKKYYYWRQILNYGILELWNPCVEALEDHDTSGINFYTSPSSHYSGNFWWANSNYIRTLSDPASMDWWYDLQKNSNDGWLKSAHPRFRDEQWLCSKPGMKAYNIYSPPTELNPSSTVLKTKEYIK